MCDNNNYCLDSQRDGRQTAPMLDSAKCAAVIPCFNESNRIAGLVFALRRLLPLVTVVDDGSTDNTAFAAQEAGATVLRRKRNQGKGTALRTGLSHVFGRGFEWAATLDGDGQHAPADLPGLLACARQTGALLVIGNRMHDARAMTWLRRRVNRWMSRQLSRRAGRRLPDTQSGFRLIHLPSWASLPLKTDHFEIESEMLMAFLAAQHPVAFAPVQVIRRARKSHIHPVTDSLRWWKWWRKLEPLSSPPNRAALRKRRSPLPGFNGVLAR